MNFQLSNNKSAISPVGASLVLIIIALVSALAVGLAAGEVYKMKLGVNNFSNTDVTLAYIAGDNNFVVLDTSTQNIIATLPLGNIGDRRGVAVSPDGKKVYAVDSISGNVYVIDTSTNNVTATVNIGNCLLGGNYHCGITVNPAGTKVYICNPYNLNNRVYALDTATNKVTASYGVGNTPSGICVSPDGSKVYVADYSSASVSVIDTTTNNVANVNVDIGPFDVVSSPDGSKVYVATAGKVDVINTATNTVTANVTDISVPFSIAINPAGTKVYVVNSGNGTISVMDTATNNYIANIIVGPPGCQPEGIAVSQDGTKVYVTSHRSGTVSIIDTATNTVTATVNGLDSPTGIAVAQPTFIKFNSENFNVRVNSTQNVKVLLSKVPDTGLAGFNITVSVADPTIATITGVSRPDWAGASDNSSVPASSVWIHAVDLTGKVHAGDTNVSFGSINVTGLKQGTTNLNIIPTEVTDLNGDPINPDVGTCNVTVITIPPFPGCKNPPQDLDNDGLYEDINGNGRLESADVVVFFKNTQWVINNGLVQYFDFNHDGRINSADVIKLFKMIH